MLISITGIKLHSPFGFFALSYNGMQIYKQLDQISACLAKKNTGFWTMHYTMTAWESEAAMHNFMREGAHAEAMKQTAKLASTIWFYTFESDKLPDWTTAKQLVLEKGRVIEISKQ